MNNAAAELKSIASLNQGYGDASVFGQALPSDSVVRSYLSPIKRHMQVHGATEVWINKPGELIIQLETGDITVHEPALTFAALEAFAQAVAVYSPQQQTVGVKTPLLSATLPDGERIQICLPPVVEPGLVSISIRIPKSDILTLDEYENAGSFSKFIWPRPSNFDESVEQLSPLDRNLALLLASGNLAEFLRQAVAGERNIGVIGDTGSGKTTLIKSICQLIPTEERVITIEDVRELQLPLHTNSSHWLYSRNAQGIANVTPAFLVGALVRATPKRAMFGELRGSEAWDFIKLLAAGTTGSMTSWHAPNCVLGFERFVFMIKENPEAAMLTRDEIKHLVTLTMDIVIHMTRRVVFDSNGMRIGVERYVDEVYFDPWAKLHASYGNQSLAQKAVIAP